VDGNRFDDITRAFAVQPTRRGVLRRFVGAATALAMGGVTATDAGAAACRGEGSTCREHANCCSKTCLPASQFRDHRARCGCEGGVLPCGDSCCSGVDPTCCPGDGCADLDSDPQHCGACGNAAETDRNEACCGGVITQLGTSTNCASCGDDCTALGSEFHCAVGPSGLFCTDIPCPPQPSATVTPTGLLCTITSTVTPTLT
jgi:hypothetical protein